LIALRFFLATVSGSIGLAANAWHSFADVFVPAVVFAGLFVNRIGAVKLKRTVGKIENILALFVSVFIFYMGIEILFRHEQPRQNIRHRCDGPHHHSGYEIFINQSAFPIIKAPRAGRRRAAPPRARSFRPALSEQRKHYVSLNPPPFFCSRFGLIPVP
jgi:hypothetical protein